MSRELRDDLAHAAFWVMITAINGWAIGRYLAKDDVTGAVIAAVLGVIAAVMSTFKIVDLYNDWQDDRYERSYLASLENPVIEEEK